MPKDVCGKIKSITSGLSGTLEQQTRLAKRTAAITEGIAKLKPGHAPSGAAPFNANSLSKDLDAAVATADTSYTFTVPEGTAGKRAREMLHLFDHEVQT